MPPSQEEPCQMMFLSALKEHGLWREPVLGQREQPQAKLGLGNRGGDEVLLEFLFVPPLLGGNGLN